MKCNHRTIINLSCIVLLLLFVVAGFSQSRVLDNKMYHLRVTDQPEWSGFPGVSGKQLVIRFDAQQNPVENTLKLRQEDVKQNWRILLNDREIGKLDMDESIMIRYIPIAPRMLKKGINQIVIEQFDTTADDINVGQIAIEEHSIQQVLGQASVSISVTDRKTHSLLPSKITIVDSHGALQPFNAMEYDNLAVRTGCLYTANGKAAFTLPQGRYTIYASRGFEYGADSFTVVLKPGDNIEKK